MTNWSSRELALQSDVQSSRSRRRNWSRPPLLNNWDKAFLRISSACALPREGWFRTSSQTCKTSETGTPSRSTAARKTASGLSGILKYTSGFWPGFSSDSPSWRRASPSRRSKYRWPAGCFPELPSPKKEVRERCQRRSLPEFSPCLLV